jgi:hypothetical protein
MANIFVAATATFNGKALTRGKKEISAFDKQVNKLGKTFAGVFGATALLNYSKKAVAAFAADEKAAKALEQQLKNTGYQFSAPGVEKYISNLQKSTGVLDDELRPAFQQLLTVTGSITKSQDALSTALNISAATGKSLSEVSAAIAKGYSGQTTSLSRLGAGLSKAILKTGDMDKIMGELNQKFAGQSAARLATYAGKMDLLKVASENVKEEIGRGILGALDALSKDTSIEDTTAKMESFGKATGDAITGVGVLIAELQKIPGSKRVTDVLFGTNIFGLLGKLAEEDAKSKAGTKPNLEARSSSRVYLQQLKLENKIIKEGNKARADELAKLKAKSEVDKLKDKFDVERIGLTLALNQATDEETKLRLRAQLAILDNNEALAKKYNSELAASSAAKTLADSATNAANALNTLPSKYDAIFNSLVNTFKTMGLDQGSAAGLAGASARLQAQADAFLAQMGQYAVPGGMPSSASTAAAAATPTIVPQVTVNTGAVLTNNQELERYIIDAVGNATKLGDRLVPRGAVPTFLLQ